MAYSGQRSFIFSRISLWDCFIGKTIKLDNATLTFFWGENLDILLFFMYKPFHEKPVPLTVFIVIRQFR